MLLLFGKGELIANIVAHDLCSAAVVEGDGFKALLKFIKPGYKVPSVTHITHVSIKVL